MSYLDLPIGEAVNYPDEDTLSPKDYRSALRRRRVSVNSHTKVGVRIVYPDGLPLSVDSISLSVVEGDTKTLSTQNIDNPETGVYETYLTPQFTREKGPKTLEWSYTLGEDTLTFEDEVLVVDPMPFYDSLNESEQLVVEEVTYLFGDLFDSTNGGAFLSENFQTHFDYERIAQLGRRALQKINTSYQPLTDFSFGPGAGQRLPQRYHGLLVTATYVEVLRHLIRSYVEQPEFRGMNVTYTDRRDYINRWKMVLDDEKEDLKNAISFFKREQLGLGGGALLVAGGIFGGGVRGGFFQAGTYASLTRSFRFYPAITAMPAMRL